MSTLKLPDSLVSVQWLQQNLSHQDLVIFDASWHMPASGRDGYQQWQEQHIPAARFFDFDQKICDPASDLPHMMPDEDRFTREVQALGLKQNSIVVVYDSIGIFSAPRVWWMLRSMGCANCAILDGGLVAWHQGGLATQGAEQIKEFAKGDFIAKRDGDVFVCVKSVKETLMGDNALVIDARSSARFNGEVDEPRVGLRKGHMPQALNLPFNQLLADNYFKSKSELEQILTALVGEKFDKNEGQLVFTCGSGLTACIVGFAALRAGYKKLSIYDGSWCEWGLPSELPVVTKLG